MFADELKANEWLTLISIIQIWLFKPFKISNFLGGPKFTLLSISFKTMALDLGLNLQAKPCCYNFGPLEIWSNIPVRLYVLWAKFKKQLTLTSQKKSNGHMLSLHSLFTFIIYLFSVSLLNLCLLVCFLRGSFGCLPFWLTLLCCLGKEMTIHSTGGLHCCAEEWGCLLTPQSKSSMSHLWTNARRSISCQEQTQKVVQNGKYWRLTHWIAFFYMSIAKIVSPKCPLFINKDGKFAIFFLIHFKKRTEDREATRIDVIKAFSRFPACTKCPKRPMT
jgi:hypothetical protein